jgi:predicted alpha/beta hydrolase family esterase
LRISDFDILIIPGLGGSGPGHWQSRWEAKLSTARRVEQDNWLNPRLEDWTARIIAEVEAAQRPVLLVAHSLGVTAVVHAAPRLPKDVVRGAFLVAPPADSVLLEAAGPGFTPLPHAPLPFPSVLVASRTDPYAPYEESEEISYAWGSRLLDAGEAGHINNDSGHGPWPEGLMSLAGFLKQL